MNGAENYCAQNKSANLFLCVDVCVFFAKFSATLNDQCKSKGVSAHKQKDFLNRQKKTNPIESRKKEQFLQNNEQKPITKQP